MTYPHPKFSNIVICLLAVLITASASFSLAVEPAVSLEATYVGLTLTGQHPSGGLEPATSVGLTAVFSGSANVCVGALGYQLFRTMVHAKDGNADNRSAANLEYLARGTGDDLSFYYEFATGSYGQKNVYWPVFYCWSADNPAVALGTAQQWTAAVFDQTTVGGACVFSNSRWDTTNGTDPVTMKVDGTTLGCRGQNFSFEVWGGSVSCKGVANRQLNSSGQPIAVVDARFDSNGSQPFSAEGQWIVPDNNEYCFKIRLPTGVNNCGRDTNGNCLWSPSLSVAGTGPGDGTNISHGPISLEFPNPLAAETVRELVDAILNWIFWLSIPIAVMVILYSGIRMITAGANVEKFKRSRRVLLWAVVGLAVIFIGEGFIALIESILDLAK